ncbi:MAG: S8 family peptidase, partial [Candidatus Helarchaeota archaeon]|nr:S8 family peptidase [Candidatus Helarchaeota archaeon]
ESISYITSELGKYYIAIENKDANGKAIFSIISLSHELEYISDENSYSNSIVDPAAGLDVLAVGATFKTQDIIASYSSEGPTNDGRIKPDICAPSSVSNATYGIFSGTSASSPHVSGAATLLFEENPSRTNLDLKNILDSSTVDLGELGKDNVYGSGLLSLSLSTPVPVKISYFDVYAYDENKIILEWETLSETNNFGFEIEKSKDKLNWWNVGFIRGNGTTHSENSYKFCDNENSIRKYYYRLKQVDFDGSYRYSPIAELKALIPEKWQIEQNFPNPFNADTFIKYKMPKNSFVSIKIYNILGKEIKILVNEFKQPGYYYIKWDGKNGSSINVPSGIYFCEIKTKNFHKIKKMVLLR